MFKNNLQHFVNLAGTQILGNLLQNLMQLIFFAFLNNETSI